MPDFESHYDEMGLIEDDQEENSASKFWEEE
jgi:hypothetical protein